METGRDRDAELIGGAHGRPAQRTFGSDINRTWGLLLPALPQQAPRRQSEAQAGIARQPHSANQQMIRRRCIDCLTGANELDVMAQFTQPEFQALHCQCNAVDLGWIGFTDDDEMIGLAHARTMQECGGAGMTAE